MLLQVTKVVIVNIPTEHTNPKREATNWRLYYENRRSEGELNFSTTVNWNGLCDNILTAFGLLREEKDFADVTLVTEDNQEVEAYKVILAALSPYF